MLSFDFVTHLQAFITHSNSTQSKLMPTHPSTKFNEEKKCFSIYDDHIAQHAHLHTYSPFQSSLDLSLRSSVWLILDARPIIATPSRASLPTSGYAWMPDTSVSYASAPAKARNSAFLLVGPAIHFVWHANRKPRHKGCIKPRTDRAAPSRPPT